MSRYLKLLSALTVISVLASAQNLVRLKNGERHEATVKARGTAALLETAVGSFEVATKDLAGTVPAAPERARLAAATDGLQRKHVAGLAAAARYAGDRGLWTDARNLLERALTLDPDDALALGVAANWAGRFRLSPEEDPEAGNPIKAVNELLGMSARDQVTAAMVVAKCRGRRPGDVLHPAIKALRDQAPTARWCAAHVLGPLVNDPVRVKPLWKRSLTDREPAVRKACAQALGETHDPTLVSLYAISLGNDIPAVRMAAADALGELGMKEAVEPLLRALAGAGGPPRNHILISTQRAYVKDFDVQVAAGAVIADPVVDIVQDGTLLDVSVVAVIVERVSYSTALRRITGKDFGTDVAAWRSALGK